VIVTTADVIEQLLTSVAVIVYVPAARPLNAPVALVTDDPEIEYVNAPVPPDALALIAPSKAPLQLTMRPL
jgi:hypothetical protein